MRVAGALFFLGLAALPAPAAAGMDCNRAEYAMGALLQTSLGVETTAQCERLSAEIFAEVRAWENLLSADKPAGEIGRLNAAAPDPVAVSSSTLAVIHEAMVWSQKTGGAFNPTIGALVNAWGFNSPAPRVPDENEISRARSLAGWQRVEFSTAAGAATVRLGAKGMALNFEAIERGWALDKALEKIKADASLASAVLNLGGQVVFWSRRPMSWPAGIRTGGSKGPLPAPFTVKQNGSLATASAAEKFLISHAPRDFGTHGRSKRYGHILDPWTGWPAEGCESVTVWHERAADADVLATAIFVMGPEKGLDWAERNGVAVSMIYFDNHGMTSRESSAWQKIFKDN